MKAPVMSTLKRSFIMMVLMAWAGLGLEGWSTLALIE